MQNVLQHLQSSIKLKKNLSSSFIHESFNYLPFAFNLQTDIQILISSVTKNKPLSTDNRLS